MKFAKIFETEEYGQVLVMIAHADDGSDKSKISVFFAENARRILVISTVYEGANAFDDAGLAFSAIDEKAAIKIIKIATGRHKASSGLMVFDA